MSPPVERHWRVIEGLAAVLSRVFSSPTWGRLLSKHTASFFFWVMEGLMCLRFTRWAWWQRLGISIGASQAFMGRVIIAWRGATKILGWGEDTPPSSPGGSTLFSPAEMKLLLPDVVFGMHAVTWDTMASLATQNLCQACSFETRNKIPIWSSVKIPCPNVMVRLLDHLSVCPLSKSRVTSLQL